MYGMGGRRDGRQADKRVEIRVGQVRGALHLHTCSPSPPHPSCLHTTYIANDNSTYITHHNHPPSPASTRLTDRTGPLASLPLPGAACSHARVSQSQELRNTDRAHNMPMRVCLSVVCVLICEHGLIKPVHHHVVRVRVRVRVCVRDEGFGDLRLDRRSIH